MIYEIKENRILINSSTFDIDYILDSGQCFRFSKCTDGSYDIFSTDKYVRAYKDNDCTVLECNSYQDIDYFIHYFDLDSDYDDMLERLSAMDDYLRAAVNEFRGIRLLRQDPFETVISFIISANNNIPRIKKIINNICINYGRRIKLEGSHLDEYYSFPDAATLAALKEDDLLKLGAGYRAPYMIETCSAIRDGFNLNEIFMLPYEEAKKALMNLKGIGPKVADCCLLFAFDKSEAFPIDTWIKKVLSTLYGVELNNKKVINEFLEKKFGKLGGLAQQYLFYYARIHKDIFTV